MTKGNINTENKIIAMPFLLKPAVKDYLWGGHRLKDDFSKDTDLFPLAETWECSTHPDGLSVAISGEFCGKTLKEILKLHPEFLGRNLKAQGELPILIKFIDADKNLSVQVHPDDEYASKYENGQCGKTEMWYVLDASEDAKLVYGFYHKMKKEAVRQSVAEGTFEKYLQKIPVKKDDVFFIRAGTVHAIGAGALIAEIQENSNLTYRLYDYNRIDKNGQKRELHIEKALDVADLNASEKPRQPMRVLKYHRGCASELLCQCKYFRVERILVNTERIREMADFKINEDSFQVLLCIEGCGILSWEKGGLNFFKGDCVFVPAAFMSLKLHGKAQLLKVNC